jgi:hypothetical protein
MAAETCVVCGRSLPPLAIKAEDEFCSAECCRTAHQVPLGPGIRMVRIDDFVAVIQEEDDHVDT